MNTHLVTGGAGFIGSHLARALRARGDQVVVVDNLTGGWADNVPPRCQFVEADLTTTDLDRLFSTWKPTHVWHLAAYAAEGLSHWVREFNYQNNVVASARLITASVNHGVERFVFTSSMAVYGDQTPPFHEAQAGKPIDPYGLAKWCVEEDLRQAGLLFGLPWMIFRPHNVYGPAQNIGDPYRNVAGIFIRQALQGEPLTVFGSGLQTRAFSYITDITGPMVRSLRIPAGETFNIGGEQVVTVLELAERVSDLFGGCEIVHLPERFEAEHAYADHTAARQKLAFEPQVSLDRGLRLMVDWAKTAGVRWSRTPVLETTFRLPSFWEAHAFESASRQT